MKREPRDWPLAVVFDLDGTLIDSAADLADALNYALGLRKLSPFPIAQVKEMIGGGIPKLVERALRANGVTEVELLPLAADFVEYYRKNLTTRTTLYEGAAELLDSLKGQGRRLGLCTNKQHALTVETIDQLGIAKYFSAVAGRAGRPSAKAGCGSLARRAASPRGLAGKRRYGRRQRSGCRMRKSCGRCAGCGQLRL